MRVHVAGNVCIDTTFRLDRFPQAGETRNAMGHSDGLGGKGANQAVAAARTGAPVTLWAAIGRDAEAARIRAGLAGEVDMLRLTDFDLPTDRSTIAVDARGENLIISGVSCAAAFKPLYHSDIGDAVGSGDIVVMQGNLDEEATTDCLREANRKGARTILNASPLPKDTYPDFSSVDFLIVNEGEAQAISSFSNLKDAAAELTHLGAMNVIVTLGARGCLLLRRGGKPVSIPPPPVTAVDTSGAGDVLCGIFAGCLAKGASVASALEIAMRAAAIAVTRNGTLASCPSKQELIDLMKNMETEQA